MISARPVTPASGSPPAMPLAVGDQVGHDALVRRRRTSRRCGRSRSGSRRRRTRCRWRVHHSASAGRKPGAGTTKPPSPWIGSITTQATLPRADLLVDHVDRPGRRLGAGEPVAERVGHRRPVDLAGERPEAVLVGHVLGGHRHRQVGPAVVGVVEDHHRVAAGGGPGDLDRVLDRLGAGVEQGRLLGVVARASARPRAAHTVHVPLVRRDHEAGVGERGDLLGHPAYDLGCGVADAHDGDAGGHVDQRVAVDVDDDAAAGGRDEHGQGGADAVGDTLLLAIQQLAGQRARDLGSTRRRFWGRSGASGDGAVMARLGPVGGLLRFARWEPLHADRRPPSGTADVGGDCAHVVSERHQVAVRLAHGRFSVRAEARALGSGRPS